MLAQLMIRKCKSDAREIGGLVIPAYNSHMPTSIKRRVLRAGSWHALKRALKLIPVAGSIFALGLAAYEIKKKGLIPGVAHVGLDVIPVVGTTKNVIEIFAGDLIPDKKASIGESKAAPGTVSAIGPSERIET